MSFISVALLSPNVKVAFRRRAQWWRKMIREINHKDTWNTVVEPLHWLICPGYAT